ncbi:MAG: hypothetical protein IKR18_02870 [Bacteroidaceae bacterium]|nr:hypothetical protein [Bacteroidaceae bacterium]
MKNYYSAILALIITLTSLSSCLKNDDVTDYSDYYECALSSFAFQDISMKKHTTSSTGTDSTYTETVKSSQHKFTIDQLNHLVYNVDSLPYGTDISRVLTNVYGSGIVTYVKDSIIYTYNSTDSIDFTKVSLFRVYSYNSKAYQDYTVKVNVCTSDNDQIVWNKLTTGFAGVNFEKQKAIEIGNKVAVYGVENGKTYVTTTTDGTEWSPLAEIANADYESATSFNSKAYILVGKKLYTSTDGVNFTPVATAGAEEFDKILCAGKYEMTAVSGEKLLYSRDGINWEESTNNDVNIDELPPHGVAISYPIRTNSNIEKMLYIGKQKEGNANDSCAVTWCKLTGDTWFSYPTNANKYTCPALNNLAVIHYGKALYAFGGHGTYKGSALSPFSSVYQSTDEGITWKESTVISFPEEITNSTAPFSYIVRSNGDIMLMFSTTGSVWSGAINNIKKNYSK